jgi:hypothetical protein
MQGYPPQPGGQAGYPAPPQQGYQNQGYPPQQNQGYPQPGQGYPSPQGQGYPPQGQGFPPQQQGFAPGQPGGVDPNAYMMGYNDAKQGIPPRFGGGDTRSVVVQPGPVVVMQQPSPVVVVQQQQGPPPGQQVGQFATRRVDGMLEIDLPPMRGQYTFGSPDIYLTHPGHGCVMFSAHATNDVYIALSPHKRVHSPMYEFVIGGWGNTRSVVRRHAQGPELAAVNCGLRHPGSHNHMWLWINKHSHRIEIGYGRTPGEDVFMDFHDPVKGSVKEAPSDDN